MMIGECFYEQIFHTNYRIKTIFNFEYQYVINEMRKSKQNKWKENRKDNVVAAWWASFAKAMVCFFTGKSDDWTIHIDNPSHENKNLAHQTHKEQALHVQL